MTDTTRIRITLDVDIIGNDIDMVSALKDWVETISECRNVLLDYSTTPPTTSEITRIEYQGARTIEEATGTKARPREQIQWDGDNTLRVVSFIVGCKVEEGDPWPKGFYSIGRKSGGFDLVVSRPELNTVLSPGDIVTRSNIDGSLEVKHDR